MKLIGEIVTALYLVIVAVVDIKRKKIGRWMLLAGIAVIGISAICTAKTDVTDLFFGLAAGAFFVVASKVTGERLGMADGIILLYLGAGMGFYRFAGMTLAAFSLAAAAGVVLLLFRKISLKGEIPFIPFITAGYVVAIVAGCGT